MYMFIGLVPTMWRRDRSLPWRTHNLDVGTWGGGVRGRGRERSQCKWGRTAPPPKGSNLCCYSSRFQLLVGQSAWCVPTKADNLPQTIYGFKGQHIQMNLEANVQAMSLVYKRNMGSHPNQPPSSCKLLHSWQHPNRLQRLRKDNCAHT